ncbi:ROK family protein [Lapillicoccus jejuensis]|uniref:Glucokinase n=1 Tax=Lapillicoccus jejuensis TaxID=402171 RepID=A0A542E4X8_9MICO|nr:ROK family protein [Lapillicoccus jejuensis]TQJ10377.1 glucokinase [Lapillicoccus jejuensis]
MTLAAAPLLLGVDVGGTKVQVALARPDGTVVDRRTGPTRAADGAEQVVARAADLARQLLTARAGRLVAVGAVCPGVPGPDGVLLAPTIDGWEDLRFADALRQRLGRLVGPGVPVAVGNDVKAGAASEAASGALVGSRCGVYLNLGTGLALAVVVDGVVLCGAHGVAGEIAYQLVAPGTPGARDGRAPLEEAVSGRVLDDRAAAAAGRRTTGVEVLLGDDVALRESLEPALALLDLALVNACCLLDPDVVVVAGGLVRAGDVLLPRLRRALERGVPVPPVVVPAHRPYDAPLHGALLLAERALGEHAPAVLEEPA